MKLNDNWGHYTLWIPLNYFAGPMWPMLLKLIQRVKLVWIMLATWHSWKTFSSLHFKLNLRGCCSFHGVGLIQSVWLFKANFRWPLYTKETEGWVMEYQMCRWFFNAFFVAPTCRKWSGCMTLPLWLYSEQFPSNLPCQCSWVISYAFFDEVTLYRLQS